MSSNTWRISDADRDVVAKLARPMQSEIMRLNLLKKSLLSPTFAHGTGVEVLKQLDASVEALTKARDQVYEILYEKE